jgi:hypothetical protein
MFLLELRVLLDTIRRQGKRGADLEFVGLFLGFRNQMSGIRDQEAFFLSVGVARRGLMMIRFILNSSVVGRATLPDIGPLNTRLRLMKRPCRARHAILRAKPDSPIG